MSKKIDREHRSLVRTWWGMAGTGLGIGLMPVGPGTLASAATLPLAWGLALLGGPWVVVAGSLAVFLLGVLVAGLIVTHTKVEDASVIVIDEIAGQLLVLAVAPLTWQAYLTGFVLFRLFDILKPWPASWADRELGGGLGVMVDDMLAACYGALVMAGFLWMGWL
jgi:phosphatidylglycerophosphatase A